MAQHSPRFDLDRLLLLMLAVGAALVVYLVSTGVILAIAYEPQPEEALGAGPAIDPPFMRWSHRWAANAVVVLAIVATPLAMIASLVRYRPVVAGAVTGVLFLAVMATVTGSGLAWENIAFSEVTAGTSVRGLRPLFLPGTTFAIVDGREVSMTRMRVFAVAHVALLPAAMVILGLLASLRNEKPPEMSDL